MGNKTRKMASFIMFGNLSKHRAGSRALTDRERRVILFGIYSLTAQVLWYQYKEMKQAEEDIRLLNIIENNRVLLDDNTRLKTQVGRLQEEVLSN